MPNFSGRRPHAWACSRHILRNKKSCLRRRPWTHGRSIYSSTFSGFDSFIPFLCRYASMLESSHRLLWHDYVRSIFTSPSHCRFIIFSPFSIRQTMGRITTIGFFRPTKWRGQRRGRLWRPSHSRFPVDKCRFGLHSPMWHAKSKFEFRRRGSKA